MAKRSSKTGGKKGGADKAGGPMPRPSDGFAPTTELTDDQKQSLWFQDHKPKIVSLRSQIASLTGDLRNQYKKVKADLKLTKADVDFALKLAEDDGEMVEQQRRQQMLARWEGHEIGTQADMFDGADRTPATDRAFEDGKRACMQNSPRKPPHAPSVPQYQSWMDGYDAGQAVLAQGFKKPGGDGGPLPREDWKKEMKDMTEGADRGIKEAAAALGTQPATHQVVEAATH